MDSPPHLWDETSFSPFPAYPSSTTFQSLSYPPLPASPQLPTSSNTFYILLSQRLVLLLSLRLLLALEAELVVVELCTEIRGCDVELTEVAAAALTETVDVVGRGYVGDAEDRADVGVAEAVGLSVGLEMLAPNELRMTDVGEDLSKEGKVDLRSSA
jgi:hypothetical protein